MQVSLFGVILVALAAMFFGYFFGLFEGRGQGEKKARAAGVGGNQKGEAQPAQVIVRDDPGLLRLKEANGQIQVELDGAALAAETVAPEQRKRLIELITRVRPWVEGRAAAPMAAAQPVPASPPPAVSTPISVPLSKPLTQPAAKIEEPAAAPKTMVGQIDSILQGQIAATPLAGRGIKLEESAGGGVTVVVGINRYTGVGDVPDPDVQSAIRGAIAEWERKFTPGL